jgi:ribosomal protein L11 methyltransferase
MPSPFPIDASVVAKLAASEAAARRLADVLAESLDPLEAATSASVGTGSEWMLHIYFRNPPNETAVRALVALAADAATANALVFETIAARDWVKASLDGLAPIAAGRFVVHGAHDRGRWRGHRIGIEIEAALAFGTGHHGTTRGCLIALDRLAGVRCAHSKILDLGTGTGVLAIAAAKLLRAHVLASDIDPIAVKTARANARLNGVGPAIEVVHTAGLGARRFCERAPFDVVFGNILLPPLVRLAVPMVQLLAPRAHVVLSGLLLRQANAALAAYRAQGLVLERRIDLGGWATLVLRR